MQVVVGRFRVRHCDRVGFALVGVGWDQSGFFRRARQDLSFRGVRDDRVSGGRRPGKTDRDENTGGVGGRLAFRSGDRGCSAFGAYQDVQSVGHRGQLGGNPGGRGGLAGGRRQGREKMNRYPEAFPPFHGRPSSVAIWGDENAAC